MSNGLCFIGNGGLFSFTALQTLLNQQVSVTLIVLAGYAPATSPLHSLPVTHKHPPASIPTLADKHKIPIRYVDNTIQGVKGWNDLAQIHPPEFLFVACFPYRLPASLWHSPGTFAVNLHPSLLPAYRGPDPLFWQLQHGETQTGISLHMITEDLDTGPIIAQKPLTLPAGESQQALEILLAKQGTQVFCELLTRFIVNPIHQDQAIASYQGMPTPQHYLLDTHWPAQQAFNFMRGTVSPSGAYPVLIQGARHTLQVALKVEAKRTLDTAFIQENDTLVIQFSPGVLHAKPV